jgi:hypothetical protein
MEISGKKPELASKIFNVPLFKVASEGMKRAWSKRNADDLSKMPQETGAVRV